MNQIIGDINIVSKYEYSFYNSGCKKSKTVLIDSTKQISFLALFVFESKHLIRNFLVLQTTLIFKFCLRIENTIHKSIASLKFNTIVHVVLFICQPFYFIKFCHKFREEKYT